MRSFTKWISIFLIIWFSGVPAWAVEVLPGFNISSFHKSVVGVAIITRMEVYDPAEVDANLMPLKWQTKPVGMWSQDMGRYASVTNKHLLRVYIDPIGMSSPNMAKNIKEIGLSTDPKAENTYKAQQHPVTKDWYVDFLPGSLPVGIRRFFQYVGHENDLSGMTFGPLVFQDNAEGWLSSAVGVEILDVPDDFYTWPDDLRWKTLRGFDPVAGLANFTNDDFKKLQAHREQLAAQKAAAEAERLRQEMLKQGVCQICLSARGQMVVHPPEQCPLLHPTGPQTTQPQRSISQKQPPSAEQSLASQSVPSLTSDGSSVSAEFLYHGRPVSGAITIPFSDRQNPGLVLRWQGAKVNLFYVRVGGASARSQRTESEIQFSFSNWDRGSYVVEATPESASGVKSTPLRLKIILR